MAKRIENGEGKPTHQQIAERARAIYESSGRRPGHDLENWLAAEAELTSSQKSSASDPKGAYKQLARPGARP